VVHSVRKRCQLLDMERLFACFALAATVLAAALLHGCGDAQPPGSPLASNPSAAGAMQPGVQKLPPLPSPMPRSTVTHDDSATVLLPCPPGYTSKTRTAKREIPSLAEDHKALSNCGWHCDNTASCRAFMFGSEDKRCVVLHHDEPGDGIIEDYRFCLKIKPTHRGSMEAPMLRQGEYIEQDDAEIEAGKDIRIYAVGSSSLLWMTWLDQLHLLLQRLGYTLPVVPSQIGARLFSSQAPTCDDSQYFEYLRTTRFAKIGWSGWDFAFEGWEGCKNGWRDIRGVNVRCRHGAGCLFGHDPVYVSQIAKDASGSNITLLATWYNDDQQWSSHFQCFGGRKKDSLEIAALSIAMLLKLIRAIHVQNPSTLILVMGKYPQTYRHITYPFFVRYNRMVKEAVEKEPRTLFVDFYMPNADEGTFYQIAHRGHPNCRGSKLLAQSVMDKLFKEKILSRSIRLTGTNKHNIVNTNCSSADLVACQTSALCWVDPRDSLCKSYSPGSWESHTICRGTLCTNMRLSSRLLED